MTPGRRVDTPLAQAGARTQTTPRAGGAAAARGIRPPAARAYELDARISEAAFQEQVIQLARLGGWEHYHTHDSRRSPGGFPDLVLVHPSRGLLVFAELKGQRGQLRPDQRVWFRTLSAVAMFSAGCIRVAVWKPSDFDDIARLLLGPAYLGEVTAS